MSCPIPAFLVMSVPTQCAVTAAGATNAAVALHYRPGGDRGIRMKRAVVLVRSAAAKKVRATLLVVIAVEADGVERLRRAEIEGDGDGLRYVRARLTSQPG